MKFVSFSRDWADEFNAYGFALMTDDQWKLYESELKSRNSLSYFFGTNEGWEDETGQSFLDDMEVSDITDDQAKFLTEIFKLTQYSWENFLSWGQFPYFDFEEIDNDEW